MVGKINERLSNIELLRILAIFGVLLGHSIGFTLGLPSSEEIRGAFLKSFFSVMLTSIYLGGVNIFVLISGWFGIKATKRGLSKFLFQVFFLLWGIFLVAIAFHQASFSISDIRNAFGLTSGYWFVMAYLGLYILSPVLNAFVEGATKKQFQFLLITFYLFQCFYSWTTSYVNYFGGYSIVLFCGLYLTARYFRIYPINLVKKHALLFYICSILIISCFACFGLFTLGNALRMLRYDNPLVIFSCLSILVFFSTIHLQRNYINILATGCFAVYIIHFNPYVFPLFKQMILNINQQYSGFFYGIILSLFLLAVYLLCFCIDRIRYFIWNHFISLTKSNS